MNNYIVEEYSALDFEAVDYSRDIGLHVVECDSCGTLHELPQAGIWSCEVCDAINHADI